MLRERGKGSSEPAQGAGRKWVEEVRERLGRLEVTQAQINLRLDDCWRCQEAASNAVSLRLDELQSQLQSCIEGRAGPKLANPSVPSDELKRLQAQVEWLSGTVNMLLYTPGVATSSVPASIAGLQLETGTLCAQVVGSETTNETQDAKGHRAGQNMVHPTHGTGTIVRVDPDAEKSCTVLFDSGEQHSYSEKSMQKFRDDENTIRLVSATTLRPAAYVLLSMALWPMGCAAN